MVANAAENDTLKVRVSLSAVDRDTGEVLACRTTAAQKFSKSRLQNLQAADASAKTTQSIQRLSKNTVQLGKALGAEHGRSVRNLENATQDFTPFDTSFLDNLINDCEWFWCIIEVFAGSQLQC